MVKDSHQIRCRFLPVVWAKAQFQKRHNTISTYAKELIEKNFSKSIDVDKEDVVHSWWLLVDRVFDKDEPERQRLMSQVCPISRPHLYRVKS